MKRLTECSSSAIMPTCLHVSQTNVVRKWPPNTLSTAVKAFSGTFWKNEIHLLLVNIMKFIFNYSNWHIWCYISSLQWCVLACFLPHYWGSKTISCTSNLHCCLSLANLEHSATNQSDQSLISSVHPRIGLPRLLFPSILPSSISVHRFLALTTWPKYWSLRLCTVASSRYCGFVFLAALM